MGLATAVVMAVTTVPVVTATGTVVTATDTAAAAPAAGGVPGTVAMGGGASGSVHEQTGAFQTVLPLVSLPGRGGTGVDLSLVYEQGAAGAGVGRHGLGQGIGLGKPSVDPDGGGTLHTASGGSYPLAPGDTTGTGVQRYLLKDFALRDAPGTLTGRAGLEDVPRAYRWVLTYSNGQKSFFSAEGTLVAEQDVHGNQSTYVWEVRDVQHRLVRAVDAYGQAVTFDYSREDRVTVTSPVRSDGRQPETVLHLTDGRLTSVAYPEDQVTELAWDYTPEGMPGRLLTRVEAPTGAVTRIGYDQPHGFPVASSLKVTDPQGKNLTPERTFRLGTEGEHAGHDFTGRGQYESTDALFDSADADYRYVTELSDGHSTVRSVYNSLRLLKERTASLQVNGEPVPVRTQELQYEGEQDNGQAPPPASSLPANYGKPVRATVTVHDPATGKSRTTAETARFDEHGRETERTDVTGAKTVTEYDLTVLDAQEGGGEGPQKQPAGFGLPLRTTVTGHDGAQSVTENTLSPDRKSIASTVHAVQNNAEDTLTARTTVSYKVNGHGEVTEKSVTWAGGAKPDGVEGPGEGTETYSASADTSAHTCTRTLETAAGTSSTVTDLVTGRIIRTTDTEGRTTGATYDSAGREVARKVPGGPDGQGLLTTTAYTPLTTTVTAPGQDGKPHITVEERDLLGRTVKTTDNVSGGKLTGDPAARTLHLVQFEDQGRTAKVTDRAGRVTVTTSDDLGRPVKSTAPNGMIQLTLYADAATAQTSTVTTLTLPAGETDPAKAVAANTATADRAGRPIAAGASFADGTPQSGSSRWYDSLGRVAGSASGEVVAEPAYGRAGTLDATTLTPQNTAAFPGEKITAATPADLTGAPVVKTLTPGQDTGKSRSGMTVLRDETGRITEERRPDGKKTSFIYTPGGQVKEAVSPGGVRTSYRYDETTGQVLEMTFTSAASRTEERTGYSYDPHTGAVTAVFDPGDKPGTLIGYSYDADGNVTQIAYPDGRTARQEFDHSGQLARLTDAAGLTTAYTYSPDGTLAKAVQHENDDPGSPVKTQVAYTYDGLGRIIRTDRGNGVNTETEFTGASQISHEKTTRNGELIAEATYTYDSHNNLTQRSDTRPGTRADGTPSAQVSTTTRYTYDAYNRLTASHVLGSSGNRLTTTRYTLNVADDVTSTETTPHTGDQAGQTTVTRHGIDPAGRLTAVTVNGREYTQTFDTDGNLVAGHDGTAWTYNLRGQPLTMSSPAGSTTRYTYWADGTRATATEHTANTGTAADSVRERGTLFHYAPDGTLVNDTHTTGPASEGTDENGTASAQDKTTASYLIAGTRHARTLTGGAGAGAGYLIQDRHGNTTALTSGDGTVTQAWNYTDYGRHATRTGTPITSHGPAAGPAGAARQPFTYGGEYTNPGGTQYLKSRTYDPGAARFTTADTAPQLNRYQAMNANPITRTDPTGHTSQDDWQNWLITGLSIFVTAISLVATAVSFGIAAPVTLAGALLGGASMALDLASTAAQSLHMDQPVINGLKTAALGLGVADLPASAVSGILIGARAAGKMSMKGAMKNAPDTWGWITQVQSSSVKLREMSNHIVNNSKRGANLCTVTTLACIGNLQQAPSRNVIVPAATSMRWVSLPRMRELAGTANKWSAPMMHQELLEFFQKKTLADAGSIYVVATREAGTPKAAWALAGDEVPSHYFPVAVVPDEEAPGTLSSYILEQQRFFRVTQEDLEIYSVTEFRILDVGKMNKGWIPSKAGGLL
ncbi:RHS repeat-associated core domain-containing protein [Streptomyces sp. NPDC008121]|uniref:RHS repeat-associated core domain-containing protein n=1 Tax=Streptomyces sp. NPDC008121 TaxID=3364809 RepID=UPI0036EE572A